MTKMDTSRNTETIDRDRRRLVGAATMGMASQVPQTCFLRNWPLARGRCRSPLPYRRSGRGAHRSATAPGGDPLA
jgi:hypothetical protein